MTCCLSGSSLSGTTSYHSYPHGIQLNMHFMLVSLEDVPDDSDGYLDGVSEMMLVVTCCLTILAGV